MSTKYTKMDAINAKLKGGLLYWMITLMVMVLYFQNLSPLQKLEYSIEDKIRSSKKIDTNNANIAIVSIDPRSLEAVGKWPWNHGKISDLLVTICDYKPKAVLLDFALSERVRDFVRGFSTQLAQSIDDCHNVVLPFEIVIGKQGKFSRPAPDYIESSSQLPPADMPADNLLSVMASFPPPEVFATKFRAVGYRYYETDLDEQVREATLMVNYQDRIYFSAPLQLANIFLGKDPSELKLTDDGGIILAGRKLPTDKHGRMLIDLPQNDQNYANFSAIDIMTGDANRASLAGKAVIIALTDPDKVELIPTATAGNLPSYTFYASVVQNLISGDAPARLHFPIPVDFLLILIIGAFGGMVLPKMPRMYRFIALFIIGFILVNINFVLFSSANTVMNVLYPTFTVLLFAVASFIVKPVEAKKITSAISKTFDLKKLLGDEPIAVQREGGREVSFDEIPGHILQEERPSQEMLTETMRLDFEALLKGGSLIPKSEIEKREKSDKIKKQKAEATQANSRVDSAADATSADNKPYIPDLLGIDTSNIRKPDVPSGKVPYKSPDEEVILTPEEKKIYGVKFSNEGQPVSFGRYIVIEPLGMGAMGTVYKGKDPAIDRLIALKTIRLDAIADPSELDELKERLIREAKAAGNLSHPNIVTVYDYGLQGNLQYIAMEYIEGYTLESVLKRNLQLNYRIVASIIIQVCSALDYAHKMGIIHRDIKPANIMVMENFKVKVMDFGIAHFQSSSMTQTGVAMGTPNYISPEQLRGKDVAPCSDLFSLGVVLYELLTHRRPFTGDNISALVYKILNEDPVPASSLDPKIPALFDLILKKALAKDPSDRYRAAKDMAAALEDFTHTLGRRSVGV